MIINFSIFKSTRFLFLCLLLAICACSLFAVEPAESKFASIRVECEKVLASDASPQQKSCAQLRLAQSYQTEKSFEKAIIEYEKIKADKTYPDVHRYEADESIKEIKRVINGLPPRDPAATRTTIPAFKSAKEYFVSVDGSDNNPGTKEKPFKTIEKARDAIRGDLAIINAMPKGGFAITIMPGEYPIKDTFSLIGSKDSGTIESPIIYRAQKKGTVVFYGGSRLSGFKLVTDEKILTRLPEESRGKVYQCDLKALGITDYGELKVRGMGQPPSPPTLELFFNGKPMTLSRWPNVGFVKIKKLVEPGAKGIKPSVIEYDSPRHERWTKAEDLWLFGYFKWLWADATIKVASIDTTAKTLTTAEAYNYGGDGMNDGQGIIYYAFNLLEEIDTPGEWYLDRANGILYLWPPSDPAQAVVEIGQLSVPMISMDKVANVQIEGITFDLSRYNGIIMKDCENCLIAGAVVKRFAGNGITINGGKQCGIISSDINTIGRRATEVIGGNRAALTPGGHFVENCRIYDFGRIDRTYTPAIQLEGVGNRAAHNEMYNCPSSVMRIEGNDHIIEYNVVHDAVQESDDQGSMELWGNPTYRGVIFRYNKFSNIGITDTRKAVNGQAAIRFDDAISGMQVYGNIFYRSSGGIFGAVQINGGRDNIIDNNIFAECKKGITGRWYPGNEFWQKLATKTAPNNFYTNDLYQTRYPAIMTMTDNKGTNFVWRNIFYKCGNTNLANYDAVGNGIFTTDPGFANTEKGDYTIKSDAEMLNTIGFKPLPIAEMGLYED
ncbi:MAG: right-handed parallel beta-helix repeat-containing protein, partial [bacterium]